MQNLSVVSKFLGKIVAESVDTRNHCQKVFQLFCTASCLTVICATLNHEEVLKIPQVFLLAGLLVLPVQYLFFIVYKNWVGQGLRDRHWNEYNIWRGFQLVLILLLLFWLFPLATASIVLQLFSAAKV